MKFKVDENLPNEFVLILQSAQHDAVSVVTQGLRGEHDPGIIAVCQQEQRVLVTLDTGFADIRAYPPADSPGIIVLRVRKQDKHYLLGVFHRTVPLLAEERLEHRLWIVEETRVRIRGEQTTGDVTSS